jgi:tRNA U34 2-thiouridine synthase MnmA/TrmU
LAVTLLKEVDLTMKTKKRAIFLFSGGLDSILAAELLKRIGVEVYYVTFVTPFFSPETALIMARTYGYSIEIMPLPEKRYMPLLFNPPHGFGRHRNPCIDCHALMIEMAGKLMEERAFDFLATGEVLDERPKSQSLEALTKVDKASGYAGMILRPLSAKLLPPTVPDISGWIERSQLLAIRGRSRKEQLRLAKAWGISFYPTPAGGCLLTDQNYSRKLSRLIEHLGEYVSFRHAELLKIGRHFWLPPKTHLIVGRNEGENRNLEGLRSEEDWLIYPQNKKGPLALLHHYGHTFETTLLVAAKIVARYCKRSDAEVILTLCPPLNETFELATTPLSQETVSLFRLESADRPQDLASFLRDERSTISSDRLRSSLR